MYFISKWNSLVTVRIELALEPFQPVPEEGKALAYLEPPLSAFLRGVQQRANVASRHVEVHGHAGQRLPGALQLLRDRVPSVRLLFRLDLSMARHLTHCEIGRRTLRTERKIARCQVEDP